MDGTGIVVGNNCVIPSPVGQGEYTGDYGMLKPGGIGMGAIFLLGRFRMGEVYLHGY